MLFLKKSQLTIFILLVCLSISAAPESRTLKEITLTGQGYELGLQHGQQLKAEIKGIVSAWKQNTTAALGKDADVVLKEFFEYANFEPAIKRWTPDLLEEVRGIADGSGQSFNDIFVLNLLDEFWVYIDDPNNHHCSGMGAPARNGNPAYVAQNMDLENYTDGFQVIMRLKPTNGDPEQLILTHPGLIALNGVNETGVGLCVNTLMQLTASNTGVPVAFVVRALLRLEDKGGALSFLQSIDHASGQNYILGIENQVFDFEASATKVVRFDPGNSNGTVYHTNHPIVNDDLKSWYKEYYESLEDPIASSNSYQRLFAVESRLAENSFITTEVMKDALRSKDNPSHPVCRTNANDGYGFTFASTIMSLGKKPFLEVLAGPPDESEYVRYDF